MPIVERSPYNYPHQAMVFTKRALLADFDIRKAAVAYQRRQGQGTVGTDRAIWALEIHPTNFCNLKCSGCSYAGRHDLTAIDDARLVSLLNYYDEFDLRSVFVSGGGDPAFWTGWERVFGQVDCSKFKLGVSTNLSSFRGIGRVFGDISFFQVHVVGYDSQSTMREAGIDCFLKIRKNLDQLFDKRTASQQVTMKMLVKDDNCDEIPSFLDFASTYPCDTIILKLQQNFLRNSSEFRAGSIRSVRELALSHPVGDRFEYVLDNLDDGLYRPGDNLLSTCHFANSGLYRLVRADGSIYPCVASTYSGKNACGELRDYPSGPVALTSDLAPSIQLDLCPNQACRHYRCALVIEEFLQEAGRPIRGHFADTSADPTLI